MAVGDIVSALSSANTLLTFQPAGTIVISIKTINLGDQANYNACMTNAAANISEFDGDAGFVNMTNLSFLINNTSFLRLQALGGAVRSGYTGIQIQ